MVDLASAPRRFWINTYQGAGEVMISAHGDLDVSSVPQLEGALHRVIERDGYRDIIVDLSDVEVIDVSGISVLFKWSQTMRAYGVDLILSAPSPSARVALQGSGLYEMFTITRT
ncbi:MAG: STAS domain-containing protein [Actinobacteria bacterium]|nr:MAG: STAS domain-containing protein [Actinomycetota bacterium]